jgi:molybdate transport system ATP-binding protein
VSFLTIQDLSINLGEFNLQGVSFFLDKADYLTIIGPTGAGKTILLESIIGFWKPDSGKIFLEQKDITEELPEKRRIGIVYQDYALLPHFTVFKNIAYGLKKMDKTNIKEKVHEISSSLGINHLLHRKPMTLSGGEQQRAALARALIVKPKLLLMDEPLSALDPKTRQETRLLLKHAIKERGTTVIHITHDMKDVWALATKVAVFREGQMLQFGSLEQVFKRPKSEFIADFVGATIFDGQVVEKKNGISTIRVNGFNLFSLDNADHGTDVKVAIRPEDIIVTKKPPHELSAQNILDARLDEIISQGNTCVLKLTSHNICLDVLVANNAVDRLQLHCGDDVYAIIKGANVRIV